MRRGLLLTLVLTLAIPLAAHAGTIFADGFEADSQGFNLVPAGWTITNGGTVDIIGFGCHSGTTCIDLDGSTSLAGVLDHTFSATSGVTYDLTFWLTGSLRTGGVETVVVTLGDQTLTIASIPYNAPTTQYTLVWSAASSGTADFSFHNLGGDNIGAILDDVNLSTPDSSPVPEPSSLALLGTGLAGFVPTLRRKVFGR